MKTTFDITSTSFFMPVNKNGEDTFDLIIFMSDRNLIVSLTIPELEDLKRTIELFLKRKQQCK